MKKIRLPMRAPVMPTSAEAQFLPTTSCIRRAKAALRPGCLVCSVSPNEHKRAASFCDAVNEGMWGEDTMPLEIDPERVWTLSDNGKQILMELPPLLLPGHDEAILVRLLFNAEIIDGFLERLTSLRSMMLSAPP